MRRRLSSFQTILVKVVFPGLWIPICGLGTLMMVFRGDADPLPKLMMLCVWVGGSAFIYWNCIRLKEVSVDDDFLYVSNLMKEITIPLSDIYDVTENVWINSHPVTIHLSSPSEFGDKIIFMPKTRFFSFFSSHPVVNELKALARKNMATRSFR